MKYFITIIGISLIWAIQGCSKIDSDSLTPENDNTSEETDKVGIDGKADGPFHHIEDTPTNGNNVFQWVDADEDVLTTYAKTIFPRHKRGTLLDKDHELTVHYQEIVERINAWVRQQQPDLTINTPRPRVRIWDSTFNNAWASAIPVCINAPVTSDLQDENSESREYYTVILHNSYVEPLKEYSLGGGFFGEPPTRLEDCYDASYSGQVKEFAKWISSRNGPCRYDFRDGRIHVSGKSCRLSRFKNDFGGAQSARFHAVIPFVFLTTGLIDSNDDEAQTVSVLAHELAHFYKSHSTNADFELSGDIFEGAGEENYSHAELGYNFFYTQTETPRPIRPSPREDSDEIRRRVLRFSPNQKNSYKDVEGAVLDPTLRPYVVSIVYRDFPYEADASCLHAHDILMENRLYDAEFSTFTAEQALGYLEFESALLECSRSVVVPEDLELRRIVESFTKPMGFQVPDFQMEGTLEEILLELDSRMRVYTEEEIKFYDFMARERIGFYTPEQEADELAAEFLSVIGRDPMAQALLELQRAEFVESDNPVAYLRINGVSSTRCRELFDNDFIDPETGEYVFIPIGSLTNIHHGSCYRAFNIHREVVAHGYVANPEPPEPEFSLDESGTVGSGVDHRFTTGMLQPGRYTFTMSGTGDADLYVRVGGEPTTRDYNCRPYSSGSNETCTIELSERDTIHIMVRGFANSSDYHLIGS